MFVAAFALVAAFLSAFLYWSRIEVKDSEYKRLEGISRYVDESLSRQLTGLDAALARLAVEYREMRLANSFEEASRQMSMLSEALQSVRELAVYDANGVAVASEGVRDVGRDFYAEEFFSVLRLSERRDAVHLSRPEVGRDGLVTLRFSHGIYSENGRFLGVVSAVLDEEFFSFVIKSALLAPDMRATLAHEDGQIFVTVPSSPTAYSINVASPGSAFLQHVTSGAARTVYEGIVSATGKDRFLMLSSIKPVGVHINKPMILGVSRDREIVYSNWRSQVSTVVLIYLAAFATAFFARTHVLARTKKSQISEAASQALLRQSALRLERALEGADLGLWELYLQHQVMNVDARGARMLGYGNTAVHKGIAEWTRTLHPSDRLRNLEAFQAHIDKRSESYECEFRVEIAPSQYEWFFSRGKATEYSPEGMVTRVVGTFMNINDRKTNEAALSEALKLQKRTGIIAKIGGWTLDVATEQTTWTEEVYKIHDLTEGNPPDLISALDFYTEESRPVIVKAVQDCIALGIPWDLELQIVTAKGRPVWVRAQGEAVRESGMVLKLAGAFQDITVRKNATLELERANEILAELSYTDALTGLGNRRLFDESLIAEWGRMSRQGCELSLLMIDIDFFKRYNDLHGHPGGDMCLRLVAEVLKDNLWRSHERAMRYGGEEFVVLLPGTSALGARQVAERLLEAVRNAAIPHGGSMVSDAVTLSIGIATVHPRIIVAPELLTQLADEALYAAKANGRAQLATKNASA